MTYVNSVNTIEIDFADRISSAFQGMFSNIAKARLARRTVRELSALSSRELEDLGLNRSMIKSVARQTAYGL